MESMVIEVHRFASTTKTLRICQPAVLAETTVVAELGETTFKVGEVQEY